MISFDTNLLLYSLNKDSAEYHNARAFFTSLPSTPGTVAICELVLVELYVLLRNPAVVNAQHQSFLKLRLHARVGPADGLSR